MTLKPLQYVFRYIAVSPIVAMNAQVRGQVIPTLVGKDQFFGASGDGPTYDYPDPVGAKEREPRGFAASPFVPRIPVTLPQQPLYYQGLDWPNPTRRVWPRLPYMTPVRTNKSGSTTSSAPPIQQPFYYQGLDWPNPRSAFNWVAEQKTHYTVFANLDTVYGGPGQTTTFDWPNPVGLRRGPDHSQCQNLLNTLL